MAKPWLHAGLILTGALLLSSHSYSFALDPDKWCKVSNHNRKAYEVSNDDSTKFTTWGNLYCRKAGDKSNGTLVAKKTDRFRMEPGGNYEFYFDTTTKKFAMHLRLKVDDPGDPANNQANAVNIHVSNLPPEAIRGFVIAIDSKPMKACNIIVDPSGFRNIKGGVLFDIQPAAGELGAEEVLDKD